MRSIGQVIGFIPGFWMGRLILSPCFCWRDDTGGGPGAWLIQRLIVVMRSIQVHAASNQSLPEMAIDSLEWSKFTKCPILKTQNWGPMKNARPSSSSSFFLGLQICHPRPCHRVTPFLDSKPIAFSLRGGSHEDVDSPAEKTTELVKLAAWNLCFLSCFCWGLKKKVTRFLREIYNEIYMQVSSNICCDSLQRGPVLCPTSVLFRWNNWKNQKETNLWKIGSS